MNVFKGKFGREISVDSSDGYIEIEADDEDSSVAVKMELKEAIKFAELIIALAKE